MKITDSFAKAAPKVASASAASATAANTFTPANFEKSAWIDSLKPEVKDLLEVEIDNIHPSWLPHVHKEVTKPTFLSLKKYLAGEYKKNINIFPPKQDIYSWTRLTPFDKIKVIIIGQDPYHGKNQAHGLAFSVNPPTPPPPSLRNMYKCLANDYPDFEIPKSGLLTQWAEQGVLMLNTCLTVEEKKANSHKDKGWEAFTLAALSVAVKQNPGVVVMAWGTPASKVVDKMHVDLKKHLVLRAVHPSPLSAHRGYLTCGHFKKANEWLQEKYGSEGLIEWGLVNSILGPDAKVEEVKEVEKTNGTNEEVGEDKSAVSTSLKELSSTQDATQEATQADATQQIATQPDATQVDEPAENSTSATAERQPSVVASQAQLDKILSSVQDIDDDDLDDIDIPPPKKQKVE